MRYRHASRRTTTGRWGSAARPTFGSTRNPLHSFSRCIVVGADNVLNYFDMARYPSDGGTCLDNFARRRHGVYGRPDYAQRQLLLLCRRILLIGTLQPPKRCGT